MIAIPFAILALAAGIYLLIQVKQAGLGPMYHNLSWLVVVLSLLFMLGGAARGAMHWRMHRMEASAHTTMMHDGMNGCPMDGPKMPAACCQPGAVGGCMKEGHCDMDMSGSAMKDCCKPGASASCMKDSHCAMGIEGAGKMDCCKDGKSAMPACCAKDSGAKK